jgi:hypothetical protein
VEREFQSSYYLSVENQLEREMKSTKKHLPPPYDKQILNNRLLACFQGEDLFEDIADRVANYIANSI